jgi:hypothetical protein
MYAPPSFLVTLVAHATFGEFLGFAFGFSVVSVEHEVLRVPRPPT